MSGKSGTVKAITLNFIELASVDNVQIIIPNAQVWGNTITNYSVYNTRRAEWVFGVGYGANLADAERIIREVITADPRSHAEPEPFVQVNALNDSSVDFLVRVWCDRPEYFAYQADIKRKIKEAFDVGGNRYSVPDADICARARRVSIYDTAGHCRVGFARDFLYNLCIQCKPEGEKSMSGSAKIQCLDDLRNRILSLDIAPGSDLDELRLCDHYGISRTPLREVLQRLAGEGFLTLADNRGAKVASMDFGVMRVFFQTAPLVYANIASLAAENRTSGPT